MVINVAALCESGTIRLVSERDSYFRRYGRVEICINQAWSTICDQHWDNIDASVVCSQLGFSPYGTVNNVVFIVLQ
jgi:deleted-in-malignant-brain-tumors protein 1